MVGAVRLLTGPADEHRLAHHGGACRSAGDQTTFIMHFAKAREDRCVTNLAGDTQLVAAGEEDRISIADDVDIRRIERFAPAGDLKLVRLHSELSENRRIRFERTLRLTPCDSRHHQLASLCSPRNFAKDDLFAFSVLVATNNDQSS